MNRRQFLLSGSAAAFAAMLPVPVLAAVPAYPEYTGAEIDRLTLIEQALNATAATWDMPAVQACGFGFPIWMVGSTGELRDLIYAQVFDEADAEMMARVAVWADIGKAAQRKFDNDHDAWRTWARNHDVVYSYSAIWVLSTGGVPNLISVLRMLNDQAIEA